MSRRKPALSAPSEPRLVRCAIYTRKSTEAGLDQEFNSLDAQREAAEAFIASQRTEGWALISESFDDGGFTGANMDRPALEKLMVAIEAGRVDCVVTYKVDRLSRSLLDFARMMEVFERKGVSFVSVTQQFNTATPMGRLVLNVLLSFAQFEREMTCERVRDKVRAARRKGKWVGGNPALGYDIAPEGRRLLLNEGEARRVRRIFELYEERGSLLQTIGELERLGWTTKVRHSRRGDRPLGGRPFDKQKLYGMLRNRLYLGEVEYEGAIYPGEHPPIVDRSLWEKVQERLSQNGKGGRAEPRTRHETLLRGLLTCPSCASRMGHHFTVKGKRRYRYYVCSRALKEGWTKCPTKTVPADEIERVVLDEVKSVLADPRLVGEILRAEKEEAEKRRATLRSDRDSLVKELRSLASNTSTLVAEPPPRGQSRGQMEARLADIAERTEEVQRLLKANRLESTRLADSNGGQADLNSAGQTFDLVWTDLDPAEKARVLHLLVEDVTFDAVEEKVAIRFRPDGLRALQDGAAVAEAFA